MAMRAAAASLRAAGVSASGGGRGVGCCGGGTGLSYGHQTPCFREVPARVRAGGGPRYIFNFLKGRGNPPTTNRITEGSIKNDQLMLETGQESSQNRDEVLKLKLELKFEKALGNQRLEYEGKLSAVQKEYDMKLADQRKEFDAKVADQKKDYDEKFNAIKASQDECFNKIGDAQTDVKLLSQRYDKFEDSWDLHMQNVQFIIKAVAVVGGAALTYLKLSEYVKLPLTRYKAIKGNPLEFTGKDWFE